jgi:hypothetical protein
MAYHYVRGTFYEGEGYQAGAGTIMIELGITGQRDEHGRSVDTTIRDYETGEPLLFRDCGDGVATITNGCWEFSPDATDIARLGLVPVRTVARGGWEVV